MNDTAYLFFVIAALYLIECIVWTRDDARVLQTLWGRTWTLQAPMVLLPQHGRAVAFGWPLPPLGYELIAQAWPMALSADGVVVSRAASVAGLDEPRPDGPPLPLRRIGRVASEAGALLLNDATFARTATRPLARALAELLRRLQTAPREEREALIVAELRRSLDTPAAAQRLDQLRNALAPVRLAANGLWLFLFVAAPLFCWFRGLALAWPALLLLLVGLLVLTASAFSAAHQSVHGDAPGLRTKHVALMFLAPLSALRAHSALAREALGDVHPLVLARLLLPRAEYVEFAGAVFRAAAVAPGPAWNRAPADVARLADVTSALSEADASLRDSICADYRRLLLTELERFLANDGLRPAALLSEPAAEDASCVAYCPRCRTQYVAGATVCGPCGDVALLPLTFPKIA